MPLYDGGGYLSTNTARASTSFLIDNSSSSPNRNGFSSYLPPSWRFQSPSSNSPSYCDDPVEMRAEDRPSNSFSWWSIDGLFNEEDDTSCCGPLSLAERIYGFAICFLAGLLVSFLSFGSFSQVLLGNPTKFAVCFSMGNLLSLFATMFLVGPVRQFQTMKEKHRFGASLLYVGCLIMTFISVYLIRIGIIILFFVLLQWGALVWYSLSYVPYGRSIATRMITSAIV